MKRTEELTPLSHEHHRALELALSLRRAGEGDLEARREAAVAFWRREGREHFRIEEDELLPVFARHVSADDPDIVRTLVEHLELRRRFGELEAGECAVGAFRDLGTVLAGHVRHEERVLFGRIEVALSPGELAAVGVALAAAHPRG